MDNDESQATRSKLLRAAEDLLEGRVDGPLTGVRLVELAGVKRHRLTHDNPDVNLMFQTRAKQQAHGRPEIDKLRERLDLELARNKRLVAERDELGRRVKDYAAAILLLTEERDRLHSGQKANNVMPIGRRARSRAQQ